MYLNKAKFITSMQKYNEEALEALPQIAIVGKSNVGKSSFINCITNNGKLCKVGQTPGKTRLINFFMAEESFYLVDLPGYGYAKRSDKEIEGWGRMIEDYLKKTSRLKHIVLLVDIRNKVSQGDKDMLNWILYYEKEPIVVCTKA
ncbi:MAG: ribosome biogenesis GTP-binding protein YsxC, partial [Clostridia bacterium]|nr:ribosome biogenesis GTP-binding protein YsxC [Clostridia bacterium]